jgi:hypothetical protein
MITGRLFAEPLRSNRRRASTPGEWLGIESKGEVEAEARGKEIDATSGR